MILRIRFVRKNKERKKETEKTTVFGINNNAFSRANKWKVSALEGKATKKTRSTRQRWISRHPVDSVIDTKAFSY